MKFYSNYLYFYRFYRLKIANLLSLYNKGFIDFQILEGRIYLIIEDICTDYYYGILDKVSYSNLHHTIDIVLEKCASIEEEKRGLKFG